MMALRQRARKDADKLERRRAILAVAAEIWEDTPYPLVTMAGVAERAGVAKGTIYLYFATKEQLFLALLEEELAQWFEDIDRRLERVPPRSDELRLAELFYRSLAHREQLTRLLALLEGVLEHNLDLETAREFKLQLRERLLATGARIEQHLPQLKRGEGARLILHLRALLVGLRQMADVSPVIGEVIAADPRMKLFVVDFRRELKRGLRALLTGFARASPGRVPRATSGRSR